MVEESKVDELKKKHIKRKKQMFRRLHVLWLCIFLTFAVLFLKVSLVQLVEGEEHLKTAENMNVQKLPIVAPRGLIYDRNGQTLVENEPIFAAMYIATNHDDQVKIATAKRLAELLDMEATDVIEAMDVGVNLDGEKVDPKEAFYLPKKIKAGLTEGQVAKIRERPQDFPGVNIVYEPKRLYRDDTFAAQTIGYVRNFGSSQGLSKYEELAEKKSHDYLNWEQVGNDGVEYAYQDVLRGHNGSRLVRVDAKGKIVDELERTNPEIGHSLYLNLDETIQLKGEQFVKEHLAYLRSYAAGRDYAPHAKNGYAVLMEVETGKVRAMISHPDYDPNMWVEGFTEAYFNEDLKFTMTNGTITSAPYDARGMENPADVIKSHPSSVLPLGSTFKPVNIIMMLNEGVITPWSGYNDRTGRFDYAPQTKPVRNAGGAVYGWLTPVQALKKSSNVFMAWTAKRMYDQTGKEDGNSLEILTDYAHQFGLLTETGVDLPKEDDGVEGYWGDSNSVLGYLVLSSFGQTERPTTLQLATYAATVANDGVRMQPQLVDKIVNPQGDIIEEIAPKVMNEADHIDQKYFDVIQQGMRAVTSPGGTAASLFHDLPHKTAAKTGTSEQLVPIRHGDRVTYKTVENAVMIAYYPAHDPKVAAAAVVPEGGYGSRGAGPIVEHLLGLYQKEFMDK